jgi:pyridoxine 4-dehydrogenase
MKKSSTINANAAGTFLLAGKLPIHRLGFGAMRITGPGIWGEPKNIKEAKAVLLKAIELGINFIDTADSYGPEVSENLIAETLYPYPEDLVIATKGGFTRPGPDKWVENGRPEYLRECVEKSLKRLRLERLDLYQLHRVDPKVPVEESLGALKDLQKSGKIRYIGLSEVSVADIQRAQKTVEIVSVQNLYNFSNRKSEDVVNYCEKNKLAFIPWFPLGSGDLAKARGVLEHLAEKRKATPSQIAIAWLMKRSPVMIPIPGTSSVAHLEENVESAAIDLTDKEFSLLDKELNE